MESAWPEIWALVPVKHRVLRGVRCAVTHPRKSEQEKRFSYQIVPISAAGLQGEQPLVSGRM